MAFFFHVKKGAVRKVSLLEGELPFAPTTKFKSTDYQ